MVIGVALARVALVDVTKARSAVKGLKSGLLHAALTALVAALCACATAAEEPALACG